MTAALFLKHFPEQDATEQIRRQIAGLPAVEQIRAYIDRLGTHEGINGEEVTTWLVAHGTIAWPSLIEALDARSSSWRVAMILGLTGIDEPAVITALRRRLAASADDSTRGWCAAALGYLQDFDWLMEQAVGVAVRGCCANLSAFRNEGALPLTLDYTPLERLLVRHPEWAIHVESLIEPGTSFCEISTTDVPEVLRGLASPHKAIRRHAICVLDNKRLGKKAISTIVAALHGCADDPDEKVQYLAGITMRSLVPGASMSGAPGDTSALS